MRCWKAVARWGRWCCAVGGSAMGEDGAAPRRKHGWRRWILILVAFFFGMKGCSAYLSRPAALHKRWMGTAVPADVSMLSGDFGLI
jgi:hypothetical protein